MDLKTEILQEHSKAQTLYIADYIGRDQKRFDELMELFLVGESRVTQRAAWVLRYSGEAYPELLKPHLERMIKNLSNPVHDAVTRNTLKVLENVDIPERLLGLLVDKCFNFLANHKEPVAIRAFAMELLYKICLREPDLANELKIMIEDEYPHASAGFKSKARKVLKGIEKLMKDN